MPSPFFDGAWGRIAGVPGQAAAGDAQQLGEQLVTQINAEAAPDLVPGKLIDRHNQDYWPICPRRVDAPPGTTTVRQSGERCASSPRRGKWSAMRPRTAWRGRW